MFKKLQENWLYWKFRFITRRWLEMKRFWRERRAPRAYPMSAARFRGLSSVNPYVRGGQRATRGIAYVLVLSAALTALQEAVKSQGLSFGVLFLLIVLAVTYVFARFW